jgi:hypothetical protein
MSITENNLLHVIHLLSVVGMVAAVFVALVAPAELRAKTLKWGGIASLLAILTGIRMWQGIYHFSAPWAWLKIVAWLGLSALVGIGFKRRGASAALALVTLVLAGLAAYAVYFKPF